MKNKKLFALFLCAALVFGLLASGCSPEKNSQESPPAEQDSLEPPAETGDSAGTAAALGSLKTFAAGTLDGGTFTQEDIAAKDVTVINFWSTTCGPCIAEMPDLAEFSNALPDNVQVVTVCLDGAWDPESAEAVLNEAAFEGVTLITGEGDLLDVCNNIRYTPTTVFVDSEGSLVGDAIISRQEDLSGTFLAAVNTVLKESGKAEISLDA